MSNRLHENNCVSSWPFLSCDYNFQIELQISILQLINTPFTPLFHGSIGNKRKDDYTNLLFFFDKEKGMSMFVG